jgi:hypothetical protein
MHALGTYRALNPYQKPTGKNDLPACVGAILRWRYNLYEYSTTGEVKEYRIVKVLRRVEDVNGYVRTWYFDQADASATFPEHVCPGTATTLFSAGWDWGVSPAIVASLIQSTAFVQVLGLRRERRRNNAACVCVWFLEVRPEDVSAVLSLNHRLLRHLDRVTIFAPGAQADLDEWCRLRDATWPDGTKATHRMVFERSTSPSSSKPRRKHNSGTSGRSYSYTT